MEESIATIKARLLVKNLNPKYPLNVKWFAGQVLEKPVEIHEIELDPRCTAVICNKPYYDYIHIGVNKDHPKTRQRFGIFHEIGHIYCKHRGNLSFIEEEEDPVLRKEADDFAAEILMPKYRMLNLAAGAKDPVRLVKNICRYHEVSYEAATRRVLELEIYRGSFFMFDFRQLFYAYHSPGFIPESQTIREILRQDCPRLIRGKTIQRELVFQGEPLILYLHRFHSGTFFAACVEDNPVKQYNSLIQSWLEGIAE